MGGITKNCNGEGNGKEIWWNCSYLCRKNGCRQEKTVTDALNLMVKERLSQVL